MLLIAKISLVICTTIMLAFFPVGGFRLAMAQGQATADRGIIAMELTEGDLHAKRSLTTHGSKFTHLLPRWFHLTRQDGGLEGAVVADTVREAARSGLLVIPTLDNLDHRGTHPEAVRAALANPTQRADVIRSLSIALAESHLGGIDVNFSDLEVQDNPAVATFLRELAVALKPSGRIVVMSVWAAMHQEAEQLQALAELVPLVDYVRVLIYDEHHAGTSPGPATSTDFLNGTLNRISQVVPTKKLIAGISLVGHDWPERGAVRKIDFPRALALANAYQGALTWDSQTGSLRLTYKEGDIKHEAYVEDALTLSNKKRQVESRGLAGMSFHRLGAEDPTFWQRLAGNGRSETIQSLTIVPAIIPFQIIGEGEVWEVVSDSQRAGRREFTIDRATGLVTDIRYVELPSPYIVKQIGVPPDRKKIALTFDDGPSQVWTPQVLDVLAKYRVPATFFMVGRHALEHRDLVRRVYDEGHEIGNHTFTHTRLAPLSSVQTAIEMNITHYIIASIIDRDIRFFRQPYDSSPLPATEQLSPAPNEFLLPLFRAHQHGYLTVGTQLDPQDWAHPGTQQIIAAATSRDDDWPGYIILLHDSGGDRRQTLAALPSIIESYQAQGFEFTTVSGLLGQDRAFGMPPLTLEQRVKMEFVAACFIVFHAIEELLPLLLQLAIMIGLVRLGIVVTLGIVQYWQRRPPPFDTGELQPLVSILVPAYNEGKVIGATIESLLRSNYSNYEILVVDDGSKDNTVAVARQYEWCPKVRVISKANGGKASALNLGIREARGEIVVVMDADTVFDPNFLPYILGQFRDQTVGGVSGNAKVGNRDSLIAGCQSIEYITSFNLDRRAYTLLNCVTVVPGAAGAWRRRDLLAVGGFGHDNLAEDADLTVSIRRLGRRIVYEDRAIAWTEAPSTIRDFIKQRRRWSYGTLQVLWKHRSVLFRPRYGALGFLSFPFAVLYLALSLIAPAMDIAALWSVLKQFWEAAYLNREGPLDAAATLQSFFWVHGPQPLLYYIAFILIEWVQSLIAFLMDRERLRPLLWVPVQRFILRWLLYYALFATFVTALKGFRVGWGKLERQGAALGPGLSSPKRASEPSH